MFFMLTVSSGPPRSLTSLTKECFTSGYSEDNVNANKPCVIKELQLRKLRISHISGEHPFPPPASRRDKESGYVLQ